LARKRSEEQAAETPPMLLAPAVRRDSFFGASRAALARAFSGLVGGAARPRIIHVRPDLPDGDLERMAERVTATIEAPHGEVRARESAAELGRAYVTLSDQGKARFLALLAERFALDREQVREAYKNFEAVNGDAARQRQTVRALEQAITPAYAQLFRRLNSLEEGVKFLVDLRADLLRLRSSAPEIAVLDADLQALLSTWFDVGFLELRLIDWNAPASLLEKLVAYEAVHEITSWSDLKHRLTSNRRCYGLFHPNMRSEPLIFVEVALVSGLSASIQDLLDQAGVAYDPERADTAIFYSISNAQSGLAGVSFGEFLIKRVVAELRAELPRLKTFATLSPIPGFGAWLKEELANGLPGFALTKPEVQVLEEAEPGRDAPIVLKEALTSGRWLTSAQMEGAVKQPLLRLCVAYLTQLRDGRGGARRALDSVAHFHLSNGARIERLNWKADISAKGLSQSYGIMVNYRYKPDEIEANFTRYAEEGEIVLANGVKALAAIQNK
jgi:malonyl-CoA decarboxylase